MSVNLTIGDLAQLLQSYYVTHQAIYNNQTEKTGYVFEDGVVSAFEPIKVNISFVSEGAGYSNLAGAITLNDLLAANPDDKVISLFQDKEYNWALDGVESGVLTPFFADNIDINGAWLDDGNPGVNNPTSITLLPGDNSLFYLATGYGHIPIRRADYLFSIDDVGSLTTGKLPPEGSYVVVTDLGNGEYEVAWEDLTGGGDRDFDDVVLKFDIDRIPYYERMADVTIPETATVNNTYAFQVGDVVVEAWYGTNDEGTPVLWFKTTALNDLREGYTIEVLDQNGNPYPNVGSNPYTTPVLKAGESDIQYFAPVDPSNPATLKVVAPAPATAELEKRAIIGYSTKTITFGDEASATFQIPVLDITEKVELTFGKYERLMPNGETVIATVPAAVESQTVTPTAEPITETINIENPGKPVKPDKADFIDPTTGELDKEAYNAAVAEYKEALAAYKTALKEYKAAVKAVKLEAKGQVKSLKVEEKAIKTVNKALAKLVKGEQKADKYVTKAEVSLEKAANYRTLAEDLRTEANEKATTLLGEGWTMEDLEAKLVKPDKADFIDPETGELDKEAYDAAVAEYKEAKAIAKLFAKADKYDLKADKLEAKAELYQQKALEVTAKTVDKFKSTLESLIAKYTGKAESLKATGEGLLAQAQNLTGADYYKALGKGLYSVELAEGYARGAEIATAVLETYVNVDVSVNPDVASSLDSVDISNVNVSI